METPQNNKKWTVMVWMAGDNNLEDAGLDDLQELKQVGSTDDVDILVQLDRLSDHQTRRYHVRKGTSVDDDVVEELGETNTGDPQCALSFFSWGIERSPADHYLAVLWNHGSGIDESDMYRQAQRMGLKLQRRARATQDSVPLSLIHGAVSHGYHRALFSTTVQTALRDKGIAYDDTARDFLDNMELKRVLTEVSNKAGRKLDLVGFDACLMNMVEIAYELHPVARFVVGSEESEPGDGWPYDTIMADLVANPGMSPRELGSLIVKRYVESYPSEEVTQSLLDLGHTSRMAKAVDALATVLMELIKSPEGLFAVNRALKATQAYAYREFVDLGDFVKQLQAQLKNVSPAMQEHFVEMLKQGPEALRPFVAAESHRGGTVARSTGATIYWPVSRGKVSVAYDSLAFAKDTRWDDFIQQYT
ncbi:peptidase C11 [Corallococcus coralloides]|nr:peptidase C11 [Corallococcus coralloides]